MKRRTFMVSSAAVIAAGMVGLPRLQRALAAPPDLIDWSDWEWLGPSVTDLQVAANQDGRLEVFAIGADGALLHAYQLATNDEWSGLESLGGFVKQIRVARHADGRLSVFVINSEDGLHRISQLAPNEGWGPWEGLGNSIVHIDVATNQDGRLEVFAIGTDGALHHIFEQEPNGPFSDWLSFGGVVKDFRVAKNQDGRLEVLAIGSDNALHHVYQVAVNDDWTSWESLGNSIKDIRVGRNQDGRLEVLAIGLDDALHHIFQVEPNGWWSDWGSLGGIVKQIELASNADGRLEVFAVGSDDSVFHIYQVEPNDDWSGWEPLGNSVAQLEVASNPDGRLELFAIGLDGGLHHTWQVALNDGWSEWAALGGVVKQIAVGINQDGRLEVFAIGGDDALHHIYQWGELLTLREFVNWHGNIRKTVLMGFPATLEKLVRTVRAIDARGMTVGVAGSAWSFTDCVVGERTECVIDTSELYFKIEDVLPLALNAASQGIRDNLLHVEAGIKIHLLNCELLWKNLAMPTLGGSRGQSLAGAISTGTHGGDFALPPIADAVRAIHLVGAGGQQFWIEPASRPITTSEGLELARAQGLLSQDLVIVYNDEWFDAVLVSFGSAGVIYSVVLEARPAFSLQSVTRGTSWSVAQSLIRNLDDSAPRYVEINVNPADLSCRVTTRFETTAGPFDDKPSGGPTPEEIVAQVFDGANMFGYLLGAIADYIARANAEIAAISLLPGGLVWAAIRTAEILQPVLDAQALLIDMHLSALDPHDSQQMAELLPKAINVIWGISGFVSEGRTLVDQLQSQLTIEERPDRIRIDKSFMVMTGQNDCNLDGSQSHTAFAKLVESYEYAVPAERAIEVVDRLVDIVQDMREDNDAIVVNFNLRFTGRSRATLAMQQFERTCHIEVYTFQGLRGNPEFKRRMHEALQDFDVFPHWGQFHANEEALQHDLPRQNLERWRHAMRQIANGNEMFWSSFVRDRQMLP